MKPSAQPLLQPLRKKTCLPLRQSYGLGSLVLIFALIAGCSPKGADQPAAKAPETPGAENASHATRGANGEVIVKLDAATQKAMGLQTASPQTVQLSPEAKGYGRVLDPAPLATLIAELTSAQAAATASEKELNRLKALAAQNNASERALQAAEAAAARDQAQLESARLRLLGSYGQNIAGRQDLTAFVQSLAALQSALVQIDLPAGEDSKGIPTAARLLTPAADTPPIEAQFLSIAPMVDPQMQGRGFLFLVLTNQAHLAPGTALTGLLAFPGEPQPGLAVPRAAIVRFNGATWVYVQTGEGAFERRELTLESPLENGWFVRQGLSPQDKIVITGAQLLLSEELKGQSGE